MKKGNKDIKKIYSGNKRVSRVYKGSILVYEEPLIISLTTNGEDIFVLTSRPLEDGEHPVLLRRGMAICSSFKSKSGNRVKRNKWQVYYKDLNLGDWPFKLEQGTQKFIIKDSEYYNKLGLFLVKWEDPNYVRSKNDNGTPIFKATIVKTSKSNRWRKYLTKGESAKCCFGIAIYKETKYENHDSRSRVSNVCYFRSNIKLIDDSDRLNPKVEKWFSV